MSKVRLQLASCVLGATAALLALPVATAMGVRPLTVFTLGLRPHRVPRSEQQQVVHLEEEVRSCLLSADSAGLDKLLADDFLGVSANGTLSDKQQYLRRIGKREHMFTRIDVVDRKVRVQSSSAVVVTTASVSGKLDGVPIDGVFRYSRVWSLEPDGGWKLRNFEATRVSGMAVDELRHGVPVTRTR